MSLVPRTIPIHYEPDFWSSTRGSFRDPYWPTTEWRSLPVRRHLSDFDYPYTHMMEPAPPRMSLEPSFSWPGSFAHETRPPAVPSVNWPAHFNQELRRVNEEMAKMMESFQRMTPFNKTADDCRLTENFRCDNPVVQDYDGRRRFRLEFDVRQFKPEEIQVKISGNQLMVYAKHDDKDGGRSSHREYSRQYLLPKEVNPELLSSKITVDGMLVIEAPLPALEGPREKMIPIEHRK